MRNLIIGLAVVTAVLSVTAYTPESVEGLAKKIDSFVHEREFRVRGGNAEIEKAVLESLGASKETSERSNFWWLLNRDQVRSEILALPSISEARVETCSDRPWGCFEIALTQRLPGLIVVSGDMAWIVGTDGGVISSLSRTQFERAAAQIDLPVVEGAIIEGLSPELLRARLSRTYRALQVLEASSGERVEHAEIARGDELNLQLKNYDFLVRLMLSDEPNWESKLGESGKRLHALVAQLRDVQERIERIDLSYESLAVVKTDRKLEPS